MTLRGRLELAAGLLGVGVFGQFLLAWHLSSVELAYPQLTKKLRDLPVSFTVGKTTWQGADDPQTGAIRLPYRTEEILHRFYTQKDNGVFLDLFSLYSREGDDRKHHPEVCIRDVGGSPEILEDQKAIPLSADGKRVAMRFRFETGIKQVTTVYYWHYTFPIVLQEGQTWMQALHQRTSRPAPSVTILLASNASLDQLDAVEKQFLPLLDRELGERHLPPRALVGHNRLPIGVVRN